MPPEKSPGRSGDAVLLIRILSISAEGTTSNEKAEIVTNGGRVMALTGMANSLENAVVKSQRAAQAVQFEGKYFRHDIGMDLIRYND